jgi:hypothetical protein
MPSYRIYSFTQDGHIVSMPRIVDCPDDGAAMQEARRYLDGHALEVWDEKRKVGRLEPKA